MPLRAIVAAATEADCSQAGNLIAGMQAEHLIADKGYDSDEIVRTAQAQNMQAQFRGRARARHRADRRSRSRPQIARRCTL